MNALVARLIGSKPRTRFGPVVPDRPLTPGAVERYHPGAFPDAGPLPWLDRPDAMAAIEAQRLRGAIRATEAAFARAWARDGFVVIPAFVDEGRIDAAWDAYERALAERRVVPDAEPTAADPLPGRTLNPHTAVPEIDRLLNDPALVEIVSVMLGADALPFQTIVGHKASEQREHSDAIHMTTYPLGYLAASWLALEDIAPESGPLVYYPGSHRLPYVFSEDVEISDDDFRNAGYGPYAQRYEPRITQLIAEHALQPRYFAPRKGDLLLWHGNLIHGGAPRARIGTSRRALVCHFFARGCLTYHDLAGNPTHLHAR
ncbi:MAG TPA: phytanoyl-CoA dioxygenase family protein [Candidatus Elarobacter sp.]|nr:phytanoyl-CoA dioxygenase family protein [Candidatus Elarobacter sp.]HEV2740938.1 phytanoyl-CoA dioxygenase family protein [Candidatus Elarobacter sp.]